MKRTIALTSIIIGILLIAIPRFILPACEYKGLSRMHCSDTAEAELVIAALLLLVGVLVLLVRRSWAPLAGACCSLVLLVAALAMPQVYGYCASPRMPCHYGMVPGIRFFSVIAFAVMIASIIVIVVRRMKRPPE